MLATYEQCTCAADERAADACKEDCGGGWAKPNVALRGMESSRQAAHALVDVNTPRMAAAGGSQE